MYLSSLGRYNIFEEYPYLTELSLALEVVVFSLALAFKIKMLNQEKLISQKRGLLLRELNHRVKNSMQTILSFLILQKDKIDNKKTEEILQNLENRIMATTHLYSLLHTEENMVVVDTAEYFSLIAKSIQKSFEKDAIVIDIKSSVIMDSESVIYCGLIVNEAVTNAFKYAFENRDYG
jgi:two-component sensor histidine kinase